MHCGDQFFSYHRVLMKNIHFLGCKGILALINYILLKTDHTDIMEQGTVKEDFPVFLIQLHLFRQGKA